MKNLKLALSAVAVFAIVGTSLAFKPAKTSAFCFYRTNPDNTCTLAFTAQAATIDDENNGTQLVTEIPLEGCPNVAPQPCTQILSGVSEEL